MLSYNVDTPEGRDKIIEMLLGNVDATRSDIIRSMEARHQQLASGEEKHPRPVLDMRVLSRISDERAEEFQERLKALLAEFEGEDEPDSDNLPWALTMVMYPSFYYQGRELPDQNESVSNCKD
ncbi:hypothetical protein ACFLYP_04535 [Chloroflexota bacterium]